MTDLSSFSERDILVRLDTRFETLEREFREFRNETKSHLDELSQRVTELERISDRQRGFLSGVDWLRGALISMPPAVVAFFLGREA